METGATLREVAPVFVDVNSNKLQYSMTSTSLINSDDYTVITPEETFDYLKKFSKNFLQFDYQLKTNLGFVYKLPNGEIIFSPNDSGNNNSIVFKTRISFDSVVRLDKFPIENSSKNLFELEIDRIISINKNIEYYQYYLNQTLKLTFKEINKESAQAYLNKLVGRAIRKSTSQKDIIAFIAVAGQLHIQDTGSRWVLEKHYGMYNPYYIPILVTPENNVINISGRILSTIKWKVATLDTLFMQHIPIDFKSYSKRRPCIELY